VATWQWQRESPKSFLGNPNVVLGSPTLVANEVNELAKENAPETKDIIRNLRAIQGDSKGPVEAVGLRYGIINQINDIFKSIAPAVDEQTSTTNEIARNVQEATRGGSQYAGNFNPVAQAAKSTAQGSNARQTASGGLACMAAELQKIISQLKYN
jgi:methyl-accepting chemotaxis protein